MILGFITRKHSSRMHTVRSSLYGDLCDGDTSRPETATPPPHETWDQRQRPNQKKHGARQPDRKWHHTQPPPLPTREQNDWNMRLKILPYGNNVAMSIQKQIVSTVLSESTILLYTVPGRKIPGFYHSIYTWLYNCTPRHVQTDANWSFWFQTWRCYCGPQEKIKVQTGR